MTIKRAIVDEYRTYVFECPWCGGINKISEYCGIANYCEHCDKKVSMVIKNGPKQLLRFFKSFQGDTWEKAFTLAEEWINDWENVNDFVKIESMSTSEKVGNYSIVIMYRSDFQ